MTASGDVMTMRWPPSGTGSTCYSRTRHQRSVSYAISSSFFSLSFFSLFFFLSLSLSRCVTNKWLNCRGTRLIIELRGKKQGSVGLRIRSVNFGSSTSMITGFRDETSDDFLRTDRRKRSRGEWKRMCTS